MEDRKHFIYPQRKNKQTNKLTNNKNVRNEAAPKGKYYYQNKLKGEAQKQTNYTPDCHTDQSRSVKSIRYANYISLFPAIFSKYTT